MSPSILVTPLPHDASIKSKGNILKGKGGAAGFYTCLEQPQETELVVQGKIPEWIEGVLYRTGPGRFEVGSINISHWFDGKGLNHRFSISGKDQVVRYRSRESCSIQIGKELKVEKSSIITFGQPIDPCEKLFSKFFTVFLQNSKKYNNVKLEPSDGNIAVVLDSSEKGQLVAKTDTSLIQRLDPTTLEPLEILNYGALGSGLHGPLSAAHGATVDGITYNYVLNLGPRPKYTIFSHKGYAKGAGKVLTTITGATPAYLHSIAATTNFVVLTVWQADHMHLGLDILWKRNLLQGIANWDPSRSTQHYIIDRLTGDLKAQVTTDAFFCFHHINAYEDVEKEVIVLDLSTYENIDIIKGLRLDELRHFDVNKTSKPRYTRLLLPYTKGDCKGMISNTSFQEINVELPVVHPSFQWKKAIYSYGVHRTGRPESRSLFADSIIKINMETGETIVWYEVGQVPGEPVFIPDPSGKEEKGALLVISLDVASQSSSLVVLDAQTMKTLARASINSVFPFGFHGTFQT